MLTITSLDEFRSKVSHKEEIRENYILPGYVSFCYMIADENTFDDPWTRECRGIVFNEKSGKVVSRPLHKFFNVNERPSTQAQNLSWNNVVSVMDKLDGSIISTVLINDGVFLKSKKSLESDVAVQASKWLSTSQSVKALCWHVAVCDATAIFEWISPQARIVLPYQIEELRLLHIRDNESGEYWDRTELIELSQRYAITLVNEFDQYRSIDELLDEAKIVEKTEGWVVQFRNGDMVKLKTEWYLLRHKAMTFIRERDIALLVLEEGLDDLKSMLVGDGVEIESINEIENRVVDDINRIVKLVETAAESDKNLDRKSFAIKNKNEDHFGLIMTKYLGKEPDYKDYFKRNLLKDKYGLEQLKLVDTVAEIE